MTFSLARAVPLEALGSSSSRQIAGAIHGTIVDSTGRPIVGAEVTLGQRGRRILSDTLGGFRFDRLAPGEHNIVARKVGYLPQTQSVQVTDRVVVIRFRLIPFAVTLPPSLSVAQRVGLWGVVADTARNAVVGAAIEVAGVSPRVKTDSAGAFFVNLRPGSYMVRIQRTGYGTQMVSVTIPPNEGRRIAVWLTVAADGHTAKDAAAAWELRARMIRRNPAFSKVFSREDIARLAIGDVPRLATAGAGYPVTESCQAIIDGGPVTAPLWSFEPSELEFIEIYGRGVARRVPTSIRGLPSIGTLRSRQSSDCNATVFVWLRK